MEKQSLPPDLLEKITHARSLPNRPITNRFVSPPTISETLHERARTQPDAPYLTYNDGEGAERTYTYGEFYQRVKRVAATMLVFEGFHAGGRIAIAMHNHDEALLIYFAAWHLGASVVPLNMTEDDKRLAYVLQHSGAKVLFVLGEYADRLRPIWDKLESIHHIVIVDSKFGSSGAFRRPMSGVIRSVATGEVRLEDILPEVDIPMLSQTRVGDPKNEALIVYTSGTTGMPKGVALSHYNLVADAYAIANWQGFTRNSKLMCVLPVHHVNGLVVTHLAPLYSGGSVVLTRKFSAQNFFLHVARYGVHVVSVVPTLLQFLLDATPKDFDNRAAAPTLQYLICGAGPLTVDLATRFEERFGIPICHGYGLSETTCYSCYLPVIKSLKETPGETNGAKAHKSWMRDHGYPSIGLPLVTNEMDIQDEKGVSQVESAKGEIVIRGHNVMLGYHDNPEANQIAFANGWFRSGDEGFFKYAPSGERYFLMSGRFKEIIIRGGVKISPLEVDEIINGIPGVKSGMAVGFENATYGEEVGAYIVKQADSALTAEQVIAACRAKMPFWMSPKAVIFGDTFPVTSTGKYQRNSLKPLFAQYKEVQFRETK